MAIDTTEAVKRYYGLNAFWWFYDAAEKWRERAMRCASYQGDLGIGQLASEVQCDECGVSLLNHPNVRIDRG